MNNEKMNQIIDEAYENYNNHFIGYEDVPNKEWFVEQIKTDVEFSERWGLKIEERELSSNERVKMYEQKTNTDTSFFPVLTETLTFHKIPTKLITITYNENKIESYE